MNRPSPIVGAPMAGGVSTPALTAAVSVAGGIGFLPAGYLPVEQVVADIKSVRELTTEPFGVNIFVPGARDADMQAIERYAARIQPEADRLGVQLGQPAYEDDHYERKLGVVLELRPRYVSFTFGCPSANVIEALRDAGIEVWVTVTNPQEAEISVTAGADTLILQSTAAGGHRGYFSDIDDRHEYGVNQLVSVVRARMGVPLVAAGGIMDSHGVQAALLAGAQAVQVGTALMLTPEAGTAPAHRAAFSSDAGTRLTRAFTGRTARGIVNRFMDEHDAQAPRGYPQIHHLTAPLRAAAKAQNDASALHLWAGQHYDRAEQLPAAEIVAKLSGQVRAPGS